MKFFACKTPEERKQHDMHGDDLTRYASPCGIYCLACPKFKDQQTCRGCRQDGRHNHCDIYDCCVNLGGKKFCHECDCFPCERIREFARFHPGKRFAHFRHVAIENLIKIRELGLKEWIEEMNRSILSGDYAIQVKNGNGRIDMSPCPCVAQALARASNDK